MTSATSSWVLNEERDRRARLLYGDAAMATTCGCGLPSLVAQPCLRRRDGRAGRWSCSCSFCAFRTFVVTRARLYALYGVGAELASHPVSRRQRLVEAVSARGAAILDRASYRQLPIEGRTKTISDVPLGCVACGEPLGAGLRRDRYDRPYIYCNVCAAMTFTYTPGSAAWVVGVADAIRSGDIAWADYYEAGSAVWTRWNGCAATGETVAVEGACEQEVASGTQSE